MSGIRRIAGAGALVLAMSAMAGCGSLRPPPPYTGPMVAMPNPCADLNASIYFERDSAALTREAKDVLRGAAAQAENCRFTTVQVFGLSDPVGAPAANIRLSERRAEAVTQELARLGFTQVTFKLVAAGENGARTLSGEVEPLRRRADIIFSGAR